MRQQSDKNHIDYNAPASYVTTSTASHGILTTTTTTCLIPRINLYHS